MTIYNNIIPFNGFKAMAVFPFIFVRGKTVSETTLNHEHIHFAQQKEMLLIFFYMWYLVEWLVKLCIYGIDAYDNISFEREAYEHEGDAEYLNERKWFGWWKFIV